ncbi:MAG: hypothetical protein ACO4AI_14355 [Prochlorothrix sp.]
MAAIADADGKISESEMAVILDNLSQVFDGTGVDPAQLRQELHNYLLQVVEVDFSRLAEELPDLEDRELVLRLSREIVAVHYADAPDFLEWDAYQSLLQGLNLPVSAIASVREASLTQESVPPQVTTEDPHGDLPTPE